MTRGLAALAIVAAPLIGLELGSGLALALLGWESSTPLRSGQPHLVYDVRRHHKLRPSFHEDSVSVNSQGFRGSEFSVPKPRGLFRVVALGDSVTFGSYDCLDRPSHYCPDESSYPAQLQAILDQGDGRRLQVINAGTQGYTSRQAWYWFQDEIAALQPDLVILYLGWNDLINSTRHVPSLGNLVEHTPILRAVSEAAQVNSRLYRLVWYGARHLQATPPGPLSPIEIVRAEPPAYVAVDPNDRAEYEANVRAIVRRAHAIGARVIILTLAAPLDATGTGLGPDQDREVLGWLQWPDFAGLAHEIQRYNATLTMVAREEGAELIDLAAIVRALDGPRLFMLPDILHLRHEAMPAVAASLAAQLRARGLVPEPAAAAAIGR